MTKLIIQIPCFNEEETLGITLNELPKELPGVDCVEWLIINDGSIDNTIEVARAHGVHHVVDLEHNQGLAKAFMAGIEACLKAGADIIVNTDADNQYCADDIPKLITPILAGQAEVVVGARPIQKIKHFSPAKKFLQKLGSWVVRIASGTNISDAPSGFRAFSRNAALRMNVFNEYTYTLETIIQAGQHGMVITSVPIRTNDYLRPSRLVKSIASYIQRSILTILRIFMAYRPLKFFTFLGSIPSVFGLLLWLRWLILYFQDPTRARAPSLIISAVLILIGFQLYMFGLLADLLTVNRKLLEDIQLRQRRADLESHN
ncbi:glycosyltransferase family 2 protein [Acaryochloris marina]|uniref:Glycosyl transferase, family 2 n=1 Tax=Acaryochloris marina (strain MBIC 11017) TaxID=329726 RepID=B0C0U3_ACAM1|nr:glycosyltransferase family 2 protein [Acaryochloris marina]ABW26067.1 glycosyl transferase, family 2 [Acaryochloris marina MBIC11017]BDM80910.1 glycosyl transferase [Acaryochloris marina MBIC10699]